MPTEKRLADFAHLLRKLAEAMREAIEAARLPAWTTAFVDIRSASDGSYRDAKMRVVLADGTRASVKTTKAMNEAEYRIFQSKDEVFSPPWYGLKLESTPEGECTAEYNYDAACCEDESFFLD